MTGTCEYLPEMQRHFSYLLNIIRTTYASFGFQEIMTPSFELKDILLSKEGGETEKQVYFIQSTGALEQNKAPDAALKFDLTIPLARYVAEHERELAFPFKRYQIQPVFRGERAQKGRYREFYQCDIDVVGKETLSIQYDAEIPAIIYNIFSKLNLENFQIQINHRKLLKGIFNHFNIPSNLYEETLRTIDKCDKIGIEKTVETLETLIPKNDVKGLIKLLTYEGSIESTLTFLSNLDITNSDFKAGLDDLKTIFEHLKNMKIPETALKLNLLIARGLDYYTGAVFETILTDHPNIGSICSGGRYDNLASKFTKSNLPGVGISIGLTRLFYQLQEMDFFKTLPQTEKYLILNEEGTDPKTLYDMAIKLRAENKIVDIYFEQAKLKKQFKYASDKAFSHVIFKDHAQDQFLIKNMITGKQIPCFNR